MNVIRDFAAAKIRYVNETQTGKDLELLIFNFLCFFFSQLYFFICLRYIILYLFYIYFIFILYLFYKIFLQFFIYLKNLLWWRTS